MTPSRRRIVPGPRPRREPSVVLLGALAGASLGCQGLISGEGEDAYAGVPPGRASQGALSATRKACIDLGDGVHPGPAPLRRLTRAEYDATVADLLGTSMRPAREFPPEGRALGFHGIADAQTVTVLLAESYQTAAKLLAAEATEALDGLLGCDPTAPECVRDFIAEIGSRAYRRPIRSEEVDRLEAVFAWGRDRQTVRDGVQMVLEVILQSPDFLYRPEFGGEEVAPAVVRLTSYEMATRLAYLLLGSMPDAELSRAAEAGELETREQIRAQAERLLATERARESFRAFHRQWLDLDAVGHIERDPELYPGYGSDIPALMVEETERFIEHVVFEGDGSLGTLLTAPYTMANQRLAGFYGLSGPAGDEFELVSTDPAQRIGVLTHGSLLAHHAQPLQTSPVHRGKFIRESILCQILMPPPADLVIEPPDLDPNLTTRQRFAEHSESPSCRGCHQLMDPLGLGFENFDSVGRWRSEENGMSIDASGEIVEADVAGSFDGAVELATRLGESDEVAACMVRQWLRFAQGRSETPLDACTLVGVGTHFAETGYDIRSLVLQLTQTDAFLYRPVVTP